MSATSSDFSTYTRARESNAPMTSNEGFSVVAPMNTSVPSSTCGRKLSCWALLKRCTSSRNSMVGWPAAATWRARATASRMSLMPACTAESAMNSASQAAAISRASVVLPVPGGPHRIIECRARAAMASYSGLPGASSCRWPTYSSSTRGRMRSASGRQPVRRASAIVPATSPNAAAPRDTAPGQLWRRRRRRRNRASRPPGPRPMSPCAISMPPPRASSTRPSGR